GAAGVDVLGDQLRVALETAGREDRRLLGRLAEAYLPGRADERVGEAARVEALPDRPRIAGLVCDHRRAERLEPRDAVVEALPHEPLQALVAGRALRPEVVPFAEAPDDAAREQHRAARPRSLLVDDRRRAELARTRRRAQAGHAGTRDP